MANVHNYANIIINLILCNSEITFNNSAIMSVVNVTVTRSMKVFLKNKKLYAIIIVP